jgi:hypothetical protein
LLLGVFDSQAKIPFTCTFHTRFKYRPIFDEQQLDVLGCVRFHRSTPPCHADPVAENQNCEIRSSIIQQSFAVADEMVGDAINTLQMLGNDNPIQFGRQFLVRK